MQTVVRLESLGELIEGCHRNPFEILGPHEVEHDGRKAVAVRAFLPHSQQAWVNPKGPEERLPMRRIHPSGLFEAILPWKSLDAVQYKLETKDQSGKND